MKHIKNNSRGRRCRRRHRLSRPRHRYFRRRRDIPLSDLRQMGGCLQKGNRQRTELPVDRLRRRHQADHRQDRDLRRLRHAAEAGGTREGRPDPVSDGDRRRRSGRQPRRHQVRRPQARRPDARQDFPRRDQDLERSGDPEAQPQRQAAGAGRSSSCIARTARAPPSSGPTICRRSAPIGSRRSAPTPSVEWPVGIGAKGNEGVANNVANTKGSIGYVEYAYAKQNKLTTTEHDQQGRQDGCAERQSRSMAAAANADWEKAEGFYVDPDRRARRRTPGRSPARPSS